MLELELESFDLVFKDIDKFCVQLIGNPFKNEEGDFVQKIQYTLSSSVNGTTPENKNADVPVGIGGLVTKFIIGTVTDEEKLAVSEYLKTFNPLLKLK